MWGKIIKQLTAGIVVLSFFGTWLAMEWYGRQPNELVLLGAVAILLGAGYYLWDDAMGRGADTLEDFQNDE